MLAAEVDAHFDVARSWFVGGLKCHSDGAFVVAEQHGRERLSAAEITKEETQVVFFRGALREGVVFGLLTACWVLRHTVGLVPVTYLVLQVAQLTIN